jgi:hypothetical protein
MSCSLHSIANSAYDAIAYVPKAVSQKFENITDAVCSQDVARVAKNAFYAAPFTAMSFLLPMPVKLALGVGYIACSILFSNVPSKETRFNLFTGLGNAALIRAGIHTVNFLKSNEPVFLVASAIGLLVATYWHSAASDVRSRIISQ